MIEQIMYFAIGVLVAALATIAILPALWRRAVRLTRARLVATMPLTPEEIAAEKGQLRAGFAVDLRRAEQKIDDAEGQLQHAKAELGERLAAIQERDATLAARVQQISELEAELAEARQAIATLEASEEKLIRERDNLATNLSAARIANQALDQDASAMRLLADQRQARIGEIEIQIESLSNRLADSVGVSTEVREQLQHRTDELRAAARLHRENTTERATLERKLTAAETIAADRAGTIEALQSERMRMIDEVGQISRERDHERLERGLAQQSVESLNRRLTELESALAAEREHGQESLRDLTRTIENMRQERRASDEEMSALRFTKARLETDLNRIKRGTAKQVDEKTPAAEAEPPV